MLTTFCSEVASCPVLTVPPARAANGEFLDVEEEANLGWQEPPPIFKHRDVMIFPRGTQGQTSCPAYRQEVIDAQQRHSQCEAPQLEGAISGDGIESREGRIRVKAGGAGQSAREGGAEALNGRLVCLDVSDLGEA